MKFLFMAPNCHLFGASRLERCRAARLAGALTVGLLALCCAAVAADAPAPATGKGPAAEPPPRIVFEQPIFDFGEVKRGGEVKHSFFYTNTGTETLQVLEVKPGCGCTTAGAWDKEVPAGRTGSIPVQFSSTGFSGPIHKTVTVTFNDPVQANVVLQIKGKVWTPVEVSPASLFFQYSEDSTNSESRTVRIVNNETEPLTVELPAWTNANFRVALKTVKPGGEFSLEVATTPPLAPGTVSAPVNLKTSSKEWPVINIPVTGMSRPAVTVSPPQIMLPASPLVSELRSWVNIQSLGEAALKLSEPGCSVPGVKVELRESQPGRTFQLNAVFPAGFALEPEQAAELHVNSSHPKYPVLRVPIKPPTPSATARAVLPPVPTVTPVRIAPPQTQ